MAGLPGGAAALGKVGFRSGVGRCRRIRTRAAQVLAAQVSQLTILVTAWERGRFTTICLYCLFRLAQPLLCLKAVANNLPVFALVRRDATSPARGVFFCTLRAHRPAAAGSWPTIEVNGGETELSRSRGIEVTPRLPLRSFIVRPLGHFAVAVLHLDCHVVSSSARLLLPEPRLLSAHFHAHRTPTR